MKHTIMVLELILVLVLAACAGSEEGEEGIPGERGVQGDTPAPTGTPYPPLAVLPTHTPYPVAPTLTPQSTYAPLPTSTPYPPLAVLPTHTPYPVAPTYTPSPTYTPVPTPTPYPTPTTQPTPTPFPTPRPRPAPTPIPAPLLPSLHDTQNTRWLARVYPDVARRIETLPWVQDGISDLDGLAIDELLYLGAGKIDNLRAVLRLPWVQDAISDTEHDILDDLSGLRPDVVAAMAAMPFLASHEATDALAVAGMRWLESGGVLDALVDSPLFQDGIDDGETTLVAAVGTFYQDAAAVRRVLTPGNAAVEAVSLGTELTPDLKVSIVRTGSQSRPGTMESVRDAVEFAEGIMGLPLPVEHVVLVFDEAAVPAGFSGSNYGFAFSFSPEYETRQGTYEWRALQSGFIHELAHYYWRGHAGWIDEGVANMFEYMRGRDSGLSPGQLKTKRKNCEAHDLVMLAILDPSTNDSSYRCNYYLGERLFRELLEALSRPQFVAKLRELYQVVLPAREAGGTPGIAEVRQVFDGQRSIVDKHWSGALNAPENRLFEGVEWTSHDLVKWGQYPTYDGHSVTFSGTLLDGAVLSSETIEQARSGGSQNFLLRSADAYDFVGWLLPPLPDGRSWILGTGDSVTNTYSLDADTKKLSQNLNHKCIDRFLGRFVWFLQKHREGPHGETRDARDHLGSTGRALGTDRTYHLGGRPAQSPGPQAL